LLIGACTQTEDDRFEVVSGAMVHQEYYFQGEPHEMARDRAGVLQSTKKVGTG